jgi:predicted DCC family thiol-disulfide oxidoreductase YuxK
MGKDLEGRGSDVIVEIIRHLPGGFEENHNKPQDSPFLVEIRTRYLQSTSPMHHGSRQRVHLSVANNRVHEGNQYYL